VRPFLQIYGLMPHVFHSPVDNMKLAARVEKRFNHLIGGNPHKYIHDVYNTYESRVLQGENNMEILEGPIPALSRFQTVVDQCAADVLQEHGVGREWDEVNDIRKSIHFVIAALEEMTCEALVDPNELLAAYRTCNFSFQ
jgi:hypothetical protein